MYVYVISDDEGPIEALDDGERAQVLFDLLNAAFPDRSITLEAL